MKALARTAIVAFAMLACASVASAQVDFSKYVALGDSLTAGYASQGLAQYYQAYSYPAILAGQLGISGFQQPIVSDPGLPPVTELKALPIGSQGPSPVIATKSGLGQPLNATYAGIYNNLGIPGAAVGDLLTTTGDITKLATDFGLLAAGKAQLVVPMSDLVLRDGKNSAIKQAIGAGGTFYTVWIGSNDLLGALLTCVVADGITITTKDVFEQNYKTLLQTLRGGRPNAAIMVATIQDVLPYATTVKPYLINPANGQRIPLIGESGLLTDKDFLTLSASALLAKGIGVPKEAGGTGLPLPEGKIDASGLQAGVIFRAAEYAVIKARIDDFNAIIKSTAASVGAKVIDINAIYKDWQAHGYLAGGMKLSTSFLTGGIFSYDGLHDQRLGNALIANEFVKAINANYGTSVPQVDLRPYLIGTPVATSVAASNAMYAPEAAASLIKMFVPQADTGAIDPDRAIRRRVTRGLDDQSTAGNKE